MWLAAASSGAQDAQNALVLAIVGAISALLVAVFTGVFQLLAARQGRREHTPEDATTVLFERTAVLEARANRADERDDDSDERDQVQDRRLDQLERWADLDNPNWRHPQ